MYCVDCGRCIKLRRLCHVIKCYSIINKQCNEARHLCFTTLNLNFI
ncbi:unnamed protein product [Acanthoscelides obtectus]|uniref:Uncharacterized protein n=1 Tax=Acanthoscelides obtectus TaxID=200917 RepID=A0A9P0KKH2_ACAOB|nr:unnamed protein product [Acanthoscelides obtectus]CAK1641762.1 hypothetical protein AOBTE_LOCUS12617 [Acanthoscelides obtectus]